MACYGSERIRGHGIPEALGVGYDVIGALLQGDASRRVIVGTLLVKSLVWSVSLGSGTSGGVLAPRGYAMAAP